MSPAAVLSAALVLASAASVRAAWLSRARAAASARLAPRRQPASAGWALPVPSRLPAALDACAVGGSPEELWTLWLVSTGLLAGLGLVAGGAGGLVVAVGMSVAGPAVAWHLMRHRSDQQLEAALPAAVEAVARGLRSGASLRQALGEGAAATTGPLAADLQAVSRATAQGAPLVTALEDWASRRPLPGVRLVVAALCLGAETGGAQARAVDGVAATLRLRQSAEAEARALATQARASAAVIAVSPVAFCALATTTDGRTARFLLGRPAGLLMLCAGLGLDVLGALWMARLTRVAP